MHIVLLYRYHLTFPLDCLYGRSQLMQSSLEQYNFKVRKPSKLELRHKLSLNFIQPEERKMHFLTTSQTF